LLTTVRFEPRLKIWGRGDSYLVRTMKVTAADKTAVSEVVNLPTLEACGLFDLAQAGERKNRWIWERMGSPVPK